MIEGESEEVVNDSNGNLSSQIPDINMEETPSTSMPRRSGRNTQTPSYLDDYFVFQGEVHSKVSLEEEHKTYKQALNYEESGLWLEAMREELNSMERNGVWELVDLPQNHQAIGSKWIFKRKLNASGGVEKYKARLVARDIHKRKE